VTEERVLVVDDEPGMREFLKIMLEKMGYQTEATDSGENAIRHLEHGKFDLVICDLSKIEGNSKNPLYFVTFEPPLSLNSFSGFLNHFFTGIRGIAPVPSFLGGVIIKGPLFPTPAYSPANRNGYLGGRVACRVIKE
jgi:hypothetical protein